MDRYLTVSLFKVFLYVSLHFKYYSASKLISFFLVRGVTGGSDSPSSLMFKMANNCAVNSFQDNRHVNQWRVWGRLLEGP